MKTRYDHRPWGFAVGLLAACLVTLVGVLSGLDPYVILLRAVAASVATGCAASVVAAFVVSLNRRS
ncbi:MAG: hypothetical protein WD648_01035 [Planctomycetaceae bacterium]